jgi:hypothetical protein
MAHFFRAPDRRQRFLLPVDMMGAGYLPRRAAPDQRAHQNAEVQPGDMNQIAFVEVLAPAQPGAAHSAAIEDMSEAALDNSPRRRRASRPTPDFNRARLG